MDEPPRHPPEVAEYELLRAHESSDLPPERRRIGLWLVVAGLIAAAAVAAYVVFGRRPAPPPAPAGTQARVAAPQSPSRPLGANAAPVDLPPLDQTDALVRQFVRQATTHPRVLAWLTTEGLLRNVAVVIANVAEGTAPSVHLRVLRPTANFEVTPHGADLMIDPHSYRRYDALASAAASLDPADAARLYATFKPRLDEAYRDLGSATPLDRAVEQAIVLLLKTPVVPDPILVKPHGGTGYAFVDPKLEALTPAQKQLLRTGAANVRVIQSALRSIALALGIPPDHLPPLGRETRAQ